MFGEMGAWGSRRDGGGEASAEGKPVPSESGSELDGPEVEEGSGIV